MPSYNKVLLMGNLTRDPELRYTANNTPVCQIGLATNRKWRDPNGEMKEEVTFIDCEAWARTAEVINQYLRKGKPIFIEGRLRLDQWQDKDGNPRSKIKVVVESFEFIDSRADGGGPGGGGPPGGEYEGAGGGHGGGPPPQQRAPYQPRTQAAPRQYNNPPQQSAPPQQAAPQHPQQQPPMEPHQPMDDADIPF